MFDPNNEKECAGRHPACRTSSGFRHFPGWARLAETLLDPFPVLLGGDAVSAVLRFELQTGHLHSARLPAACGSAGARNAPGDAALQRLVPEGPEPHRPKPVPAAVGSRNRRDHWIAAVGNIPEFIAAVSRFLRLPGSHTVMRNRIRGGAAVCRRMLYLHAVFLLRFDPVIFCGLYAVPTALLGDKATETGLRECLKRIPVLPDDVVLVDCGSLTAAAWVLKRSDLIVISRPGELEYGFRNYPKYASRHYRETELADNPAAPGNLHHPARLEAPSDSWGMECGGKHYGIQSNGRPPLRARKRIIPHQVHHPLEILFESVQGKFQRRPKTPDISSK